MSLKDNYIKLSKKHGGTHALISKGIKQGIVNSIMKGCMPKINEAYEVAKVLGVTMEELLTGSFNEKKVYTPEQQKYIDKLIEILNGKDEGKKTTIKTILDNLIRDAWEHHQKKQKTG